MPTVTVNPSATTGYFQEVQHHPIRQQPVPETWQVTLEKGASAQPGHLALATSAGIEAVSPLPPGGRQLDLTAALELPLRAGRLSVGSVRNSQPRHQQQAGLEWTFFTGHRAKW